MECIQGRLKFPITQKEWYKLDDYFLITSRSENTAKSSISECVKVKNVKKITCTENSDDKKIMNHNGNTSFFLMD